VVGTPRKGAASNLETDWTDLVEARARARPEASPARQANHRQQHDLAPRAALQLPDRHAFDDHRGIGRHSQSEPSPVGANTRASSVFECDGSRLIRDATADHHGARKARPRDGKPIDFNFAHLRDPPGSRRKRDAPETDTSIQCATSAAAGLRPPGQNRIRLPRVDNCAGRSRPGEAALR
jgi:hypothetical protein